MAGLTNFPPTIPFPSLFMTLLKLGNLWNFDQIYPLIFTVHNENPKYDTMYIYSTVRFLLVVPLKYAIQEIARRADA